MLEFQSQEDSPYYILKYHEERLIRKQVSNPRMFATSYKASDGI